MKKSKILFILLIFSLIFSGGYTFAEEKDDVFYLGEVVVTGESEPISMVTSIETINQEEMELNDADDVATALDNMTGLSISIGRRNETNINVRGYNQRYVPVFFDGIPWYIPNDGYVDPGEISTKNISRITLTKGAASTLYGANTMGGVINIVSMKPTEEFEGSLGLSLARHKYSGSLNLGSKSDKFYFMGGLSGLDYDDFRMSDDFTSVPDPDYYEDGKYRDNSYKNSITKSLKIGFMPGEDHEFAVGYHNVDSEKGLPTNTDANEKQRFWRFPEWEKSTYYFIANSRLGENMSVKVRIYHDEYYNVLDAYDDGTYTTQTRRSAFHSTYDDHTDGGSFVLRTDFLNNTLSFSYHIKNDVHTEQDDCGVAWEKYEARTSSIGLEDAVIMNDKMALVLGLNMDIQEARYADGGPLREDDESWNGVIGMTYDLDNNRQIHFSAAKKSRFPTLNELYSSYLISDNDSIPNPNLKKEQSMNYEAGISSAVPFDSNVDFTIFYSDIEDLIAETTIDGKDFRGNIGEASTQGFEFTLNTNGFDKNNIRISYSYIDAENNSADRPSEFIEEVAKYQFSISDKINLTDSFSLFARGKYEGGLKQELRNGDWTELDDYWVFDLKGIYKVSENVQIDAGIQNILDENYSTKNGFPREGRMFVFGFKANF